MSCHWDRCHHRRSAVKGRRWSSLWLKKIAVVFKRACCICAQKMALNNHLWHRVACIVSNNFSQRFSILQFTERQDREPVLGDYVLTILNISRKEKNYQTLFPLVKKYTTNTFPTEIMTQMKQYCCFSLLYVALAHSCITKTFCLVFLKVFVSK